MFILLDLVLLNIRDWIVSYTQSASGCGRRLIPGGLLTTVVGHRPAQAGRAKESVGTERLALLPQSGAKELHAVPKHASNEIDAMRCMDTHMCKRGWAIDQIGGGLGVARDGQGTVRAGAPHGHRLHAPCRELPAACPSVSAPICLRHHIDPLRSRPPPSMPKYTCADLAFPLPRCGAQALMSAPYRGRRPGAAATNTNSAPAPPRHGQGRAEPVLDGGRGLRVRADGGHCIPQ